MRFCLAWVQPQPVLKHPKWNGVNACPEFKQGDRGGISRKGNIELAVIGIQVVVDLVAANDSAKRCGVKSKKEQAQDRTLGNTKGYSHLGSIAVG